VLPASRFDLVLVEQGRKCLLLGDDHQSLRNGALGGGEVGKAAA
jgi:hypothetical protein